ncbi:unnamed protein product [Staurois parvus]|uniref:Uncharacterized protein n=1 Tax=Staurois parvus TaxID=386267 RepID=A0ABN9BB77_9NEOB|nr:unnamed protein product [Staurois parvus]
MTPRYTRNLLLQPLQPRTVYTKSLLDVKPRHSSLKQTRFTIRNYF